MSGQPELVAEVRRWVEKAEHDLRNAEYVLTLGEDCPTDTVCFHCQQCAEKYLKAILVSRGVAFPKTHDLVLLLNLLGGESGGQAGPATSCWPATDSRASVAADRANGLCRSAPFRSRA